MISVRLDGDLVSRIDAAGVRSEVIREALEAWFSGGGLVPVPEPVVPKRDAPAEKVVTAVPAKRAVRDAEGDEGAVRGLLADRPRSVRALAGELGWPEMRVERALRGLAVFYSQGLVFLE